MEQDARSVPYYEFLPDYTGLKNIALVLGAEVGGLSRAVLDKADRILEIPMFGKKESLNVSVALGIAAYQVTLRWTR